MWLIYWGQYHWRLETSWYFVKCSIYHQARFRETESESGLVQLNQLSHHTNWFKVLQAEPLVAFSLPHYLHKAITKTYRFPWVFTSFICRQDMSMGFNTPEINQRYVWVATFWKNLFLSFLTHFVFKALSISSCHVLYLAPESQTWKCTGFLCVQ